jgi:hypothetical protein
LPAADLTPAIAVGQLARRGLREVAQADVGDALAEVLRRDRRAVDELAGDRHRPRRGALHVADSSTKLTYVPGAPRIVEIARRRSKKCPIGLPSIAEISRRP